MVREPRYRQRKASRDLAAARDKDRESSWKRGYDDRWRRASKRFLQDHPLCQVHLEDNLLVSASCVDHIIPHKGDYELFWDEANWQSLCKPCHDRKTASEDGGFGHEARHVHQASG